MVRSLCPSSLLSFKFVALSTVISTVKDMRDAVEEVLKRIQILGGSSSTSTVLFLDEVHRFGRAQSDVFHPAIEDRSILFASATTENPSFHLTTPLLSWCWVLALNRPSRPRLVPSTRTSAGTRRSSTSMAARSRSGIRSAHRVLVFSTRSCSR